MVELILTVSVIWILIMWTTVYLWGAGDRRKIIEAQWCANTIWWEIDNFIFYALTSKELGNIEAPDNYRIKMKKSDSDKTINCSYKDIDWENFTNYCNELVFYWNNNGNDGENTYKTITARNTCSQTNQNLRYLRNINSNNYNINYININKWFTQISNNDGRVFYLQGNDDDNNKYITWSIMIILCLDNDCQSRKEIGKRDVDWRTQMVSLNKCRFYDEGDTSKCKEREYEEKTQGENW